jgi:hypothetical protein
VTAFLGTYHAWIQQRSVEKPGGNEAEYEKLLAQRFPSHFRDRSFFSLTGETDGQRATFFICCFASLRSNERNKIEDSKQSYQSFAASDWLLRWRLRNHNQNRDFTPTCF